MGKNVAVFVDVANIFYAAKAAGVDIDYVTLLKSATAGRDFVRAYAYTGLDPENENQRNFHQFLARHHYKVVSKDIRKYGDGKVKANLDIELVVDLMKTARNLDVAVIVSGDGDFASAIRAVQEMGVRVEVISFRGNTSSDLIEVADLFTDITQIAKVDKGSTRSGRRVSDDDEDLSMTEVPDKQSEGTGRGRSRGRGRGSRTEREETPVAARSSRGRTAAAPATAPAGSGLVALPGEKLSRAAAPVEDVVEGEAPEELGGVVEPDETLEGDAAEGEGRRRRRRRGGRGRGRGRRDEGTTSEEGADGEAAGELEDAEGVAEPEAADEAAAAPAPERTSAARGRGGRTQSGDFATPFDDLDALAQPRAPRSTPFGSVWDQQLGAPARPAASGLAPLDEDEEDLEEPEIPEYLLAERRGQGGQGGRGGNRGGRGRNAAYSAAIERERYGGSRGGVNRYGETRGGGQGSRGGSRGGGQPSRGPRQDRPAERYDRAPRPSSTSEEPWSEVPPELEELLRAQMARSAPAARPSEPAAAPVADALAPKRTSRSRKPAAAAEPAPVEAVDVADEAVADAPAPKRTTRSRKPAAPTEAAAVETDVDAPAPTRTTRSRKPSAAAETTADKAVADAPAPKRTTRSRKAAEAAPAESATTPDATTADATADATTADTTADAPAPKRRTTRKAAAPEA